ncbi:MAG: PP2C family serine/threonine-protein phosphatase, partial [Rhodocyclaceae bacterium]
MNVVAQRPPAAPLPQPAAGDGLRVALGHATLTGRRSRNEDFVAATTPEGADLAAKGILLVVADGVGGHAKGREAAEYAVRSLLSDYYATPDTWGVERSIDTVLRAANRWLQGHAGKIPDNAGMATTLTAVVLRGTRYYVAHVGDTRAYLLRGGHLTQLTEDHTWDHPELTNVLRRAIGLDAHLVVDLADGDLQPGDRFVLVSDGVWGTLGNDGIAKVLSSHSDAEQAAEALVFKAERRGSKDNCTALVANVEGVAAGNLRDTLASASRLPLPPRLKPGQEIDGLHVLD